MGSSIIVIGRELPYIIVIMRIEIATINLLPKQCLAHVTAECALSKQPRTRLIPDSDRFGATVDENHAILPKLFTVIRI